MKKVPNKNFSINDLPSTRRELFFDVFKNHFPLLVGLGLLSLLFALPLLITLLAGDVVSYNLYDAFVKGSITTQEYNANFRTLRLIINSVQIVGLCIFSLGASGIVKIFKRLLFLEPVFFKEDFKMGFKDSWKSMVLMYAILGLFYTLANYLGSIDANAFVKALPIGVIVAFVFPVFLLMNTHTTIYTNNFFTRIKICSLLYIKHFFTVFLASCILISPVFLLYISNFAVKYILILVVILFIYPILFLGYFDFANSIFDKEINIINYKEIYRKGLIDKKKEDKKTSINSVE